LSHFRERPPFRRDKRCFKCGLEALGFRALDDCECTAHQCGLIDSAIFAESCSVERAFHLDGSLAASVGIQDLVSLPLSRTPAPFFLSSRLAHKAGFNVCDSAITHVLFEIVLLESRLEPVFCCGFECQLEVGLSEGQRGVSTENH